MAPILFLISIQLLGLYARVRNSIKNIGNLLWQ